MSKLAVFASGAGSNAKNIIKHFNNNKTGQVALIITNNPKAGVLNIAEEFNIPTKIISRSDLINPHIILDNLAKHKIEWIVLAGFLKKIPEDLINAYPQKIINIHPALLPKFGGKGMYGRHVHQAVKEANEKETGITIHYVNHNYDEGAIISQHKCLVNFTDTVDDIDKKVRALEQKYFPQEIEKLINIA